MILLIVERSLQGRDIEQRYHQNRPIATFAKESTMPKAPPKHRPLGFKTSKEKKAYHDKHWRNKSAHRKLYNAAWRRARIRFLRNNPLCVPCLREDRTTEATVVDHLTPHKGDHELFWDQNNWGASCKPHHDRKTVLEDGGFGNPLKGS